RARKQANFDYW
nr:immunoglobulin heavy chain junction region [Macaca mulatta]